MADNREKGYDTVQEAIKAALQEAVRDGNKVERIGVGYEKDGKFFYTNPTNRYASGSSNRGSKAKIKIPKGSARFIYHNHPPGKHNERFSEEDIKMSQKLGVPSAIIFGGDPSIRLFDPEDSKVQNDPNNISSVYSEGEPLFEVDEDEE